MAVEGFSSALVLGNLLGNVGFAIFGLRELSGLRFISPFLQDGEQRFAPFEEILTCTIFLHDASSDIFNKASDVFCLVCGSWLVFFVF